MRIYHRYRLSTYPIAYCKRMLWGKIYILLANTKDSHTYDYLRIFYLEKYNELGVMCYLGSQISMIVPPLDCDLKGKGGYLLNKNQLNIN